MSKFTYTAIAASMFMLTASSCSDDEIRDDTSATEIEMPEWYYSGGQLGTSFLTTANALEQPSAAVENAGM